jgi:hypothetical protein
MTERIEVEERAERARDVAVQLFGAQKPLGAAIFYVQSIRQAESPITWAELGCALQECVGRFVRAPFFETAEVAFARALRLGLEGELVPVVADRREAAAAELGKHRPGLSKVNAGADRFLALARPDSVPREALDALEAFLVVSDGVVADAIDELAAPERSQALALCAELGWDHLARVVLVAREGRWGDAVAKEARRLKLSASPQKLPAPTDPNATPVGAPPREQSRSRSWLSWVLALVLIAVALGGVWVLVAQQRGL